MSKTIYTKSLNQKNMSSILGIDYQHIDLSSPDVEFIEPNELLEIAWDSWRGSKHTKSARKKISEKKSGVPLTEEHKTALKHAWAERKKTKKYQRQIEDHIERQKGNTNRLGKKHSDKVKQRLSECNKGKKLSSETKAKISAKMKEIRKQQKLNASTNTQT